MAIIFGTSLFFLLIAAVLAFRLIPRNGRRLVWGLLLAALLLFALRQGFMLYLSFNGFPPSGGGGIGEAVAFAVSILVAAGIGVLAFSRSAGTDEGAEAVSAERYRYLVEHTDNLVTTVDSVGRFVYVNHAAKDIFGLPPEKCIGLYAFDFVHPDDRDATRSAFLGWISQGLKGVTYENRQLSRTGEIHDMLWTINLEYDDKGNVLALNSIARDITAMKKAEESLRRSNELLEKIFSTTNFLLAYLDTDFNFLRVNKAYAHADGKVPEYYVGKNHFSLFPNEENEKIFRKVLETGEIYSTYAKPFEYEYNPERGTSYWDWLLEPVKGADGKVEGLLLSLIDVSEKVRMEEELRITSFSANRVADAIYWIRPDAGFFKVNDAACRALGYSRAELLTMGVPDIDPLFPEERWGAHWEELKREGALTFESAHRTKDGKVFAVEVAANFFEFGGKEFNCAIVRDITERKRARDELVRLSTAIEQSAELVLITDADGNIQYVNPFFEKMTGYSRDEVIGRNPRILKSGRHDRAFYAKMWGTIKAGKPWSGRITNRKKDGTYFEEEALISPIKDNDGKVVNFVAVKRDITAETRLQRAKDFFTNATSHELRTPATNLKLLLMLVEDLLDRYQGDENLLRLREHMEEIYSDMDRIITATSLYSDLISSMGAPKYHVDLRLLLDYHVRLLERKLKAEGRNIGLKADLGGLPEGPVVTGNQDMLGKAVEEVLSNAAKYTPDGKHIFVKGGLFEGGFTVEVLDEGIGISSEQMDTIFEPYFSEENVLQHVTGKYRYKGGGIGLGLSIARLVMEYHGGDVLVESGGADKGTRVTMRFKSG